MATGWRKPSQKARRRLPEIRMVLLGETGSGKRSAANAILGSEEFLKGRKHYAVKRQREEAGRRVTVVNAPGWRRTSWAPGTPSPEHVRQEVAFGVSLCPPGPHALLLVVPADSPFTPRHRRSVLEHLEPLTEGVWRHALVLFTRGDALRHTTIEQHVAGGGRELQWLVGKCGRRYHVLDGKNRADRAQVEGLLAKIEDMAAAAAAGTSARYFTREPEGRRGQWERDPGAADAEEEGLAPRGPELQAELQHFVRGWLRKSLDQPPNVSGVPLAPGGRQEREKRLQSKERESQATPKARSQTPGGDSQTPPPLAGAGAAPETSPAETPPPSTLSKLRGVLEEMVQRDLEQREKLERDVASLREEWERERREKEERDREWRGGLEEELQREREERQRLERELEALREERDQRRRLERERSEGEERRRALEEELRSEREGRERLERERSEGEERRRALEEELRSEREGRERLEREIADLREARERERSEREELRRRYEERARSEEAAHRNVLRQIRALAEQPSGADELP